MSLFPKTPCSCFLSLRLCVFLSVPEFLFAFTFFPPNRGKENKNIIKGLKEITGCQSSETQSVCVRVCVVCMCRYRGAKPLHVSERLLVHSGCMCDTWEPRMSNGCKQSLSTISKQHVNVKWFHDNTVHDKSLAWWGLMLEVLCNFPHVDASRCEVTASNSTYAFRRTELRLRCKECHSFVLVWTHVVFFKMYWERGLHTRVSPLVIAPASQRGVNTPQRLVAAGPVKALAAER